MAADIINLRRTRKAKARLERENEAAANRRLFGRTKAEKKSERAERERAAKLIEGHRREPDED
jgi:hypothetical protein